MNKLSTSLSIKEIQIRNQKYTEILSYPTYNGKSLRKQTTTNIGENPRGKELLYTIGGNVN
jgi:hypothetical protein